MTGVWWSDVIVITAGLSISILLWLVEVVGGLFYAAENNGGV